MSLYRCGGGGDISTNILATGDSIYPYTAQSDGLYVFSVAWRCKGKGSISTTGTIIHSEYTAGWTSVNSAVDKFVCAIVRMSVGDTFTVTSTSDSFNWHDGFVAKMEV